LNSLLTLNIFARTPRTPCVAERRAEYLVLLREEEIARLMMAKITRTRKGPPKSKRNAPVHVPTIYKHQGLTFA
jgi:hypothetical protein